MSKEKKSLLCEDDSPTAIERLQDAIDDLGVGDLRVTGASQSKARSEAAMPGTESIHPLLTLVPPPVDEDLLRLSADDGQRDYSPDPIAEYAIAMSARAVFPVAQLTRRSPQSCSVTFQARRFTSARRQVR